MCYLAAFCVSTRVCLNGARPRRDGITKSVKVKRTQSTLFIPFACQFSYCPDAIFSLNQNKPMTRFHRTSNESNHILRSSNKTGSVDRCDRMFSIAHYERSQTIDRVTAPVKWMQTIPGRLYNDTVNHVQEQKEYTAHLHLNYQHFCCLECLATWSLGNCTRICVIIFPTFKRLAIGLMKLSEHTSFAHIYAFSKL